MLKRLIILCSILIVLPAGAGWAQSADQTSQTTPSQQSATAPSSMSVSGTVISKTNDSITIQTASGNQQFSVDSATVEPSALHVGDTVNVAYRQDADSDSLIATQISVTAAADTSTASSSTTTSSTSQGSTAAGAASSTASSSTAPAQKPEAAEPSAARNAADNGKYNGAQSDSDDNMSGSAQATAGQSQQSPTRTPSASELPKTASSMPLIALIGILALVVALTAFLVRHQQRA